MHDITVHLMPPQDGLEAPPEEERMLSDDQEDLPLEDEMMYDEEEDLSLAAIFQRQQLGAEQPVSPPPMPKAAAGSSSTQVRWRAAKPACPCL
jgi:hypothetical protein